MSLSWHSPSTPEAQSSALRQSAQVIRMVAVIFWFALMTVLLVIRGDVTTQTASVPVPVPDEALGVSMIPDRLVRGGELVDWSVPLDQEIPPLQTAPRAKPVLPVPMHEEVPPIQFQVTRTKRPVPVVEAPETQAPSRPQPATSVAVAPVAPEPDPVVQAVPVAPTPTEAPASPEPQPAQPAQPVTQPESQPEPAQAVPVAPRQTFQAPSPVASTPLQPATAAPVPVPPAPTPIPPTPIPPTAVPAPVQAAPVQAAPAAPVPAAPVATPPPAPTAQPVVQAAPVRNGPPGVVNRIPASAWNWMSANGWKVDWRQGPGPGRQAEAQYATSTVVIWYDTSRSDTFWLGAFGHELGHAVAFRHFNSAQMQEWNSMRGLTSWRWVPGTPNDFSVGEGDFAEAFMSYVFGHGVRSKGGPLTQQQRAWIAANTPF